MEKSVDKNSKVMRHCQESGFGRPSAQGQPPGNGALTAAAREKCRTVSSEHVRIAATEIM
jgi:hypothetical protein